MRLGLLIGVCALAWACGDDKRGGTSETAGDSVAGEVGDAAPAETGEPDVPDKADTPPETSVDASIDTPEEVLAETTIDSSAPETEADTAIEDSAAPEVETTVAPPEEVRFVVMGDTGEGNERQYKVAEAIRQKCERDGCDFALLLGDNIYDAGVESTLDQQWLSKFELPYENLDMPFYAVLGNHDNGGFLSQLLGDTFGGAGAEFERGDVQVAYTQVSSKFRMPGRTYDFVAGPAHFFALDSNDMVWSKALPAAEGRTQWQVDTLPGRIDQASATWRIAFAHHPWISNGRHGDAGEYEGLEEDITDLIANVPGLGDLAPVVTGDGVREALEVIVCGRVDLFFSGHDHNRQWHVPSTECPGTTFVVSGAGAKLTELRGDHPVLFQSDAKAGFFWVYLKDRQIEVEAIDEDGMSEWSWQGSK